MILFFLLIYSIDKSGFIQLTKKKQGVLLERPNRSESIDRKTKVNTSEMRGLSRIENQISSSNNFSKNNSSNLVEPSNSDNSTKQNNLCNFVAQYETNKNLDETQKQAYNKLLNTHYRQIILCKNSVTHPKVQLINNSSDNYITSMKNTAPAEIQEDSSKVVVEPISHFPIKPVDIMEPRIENKVVNVLTSSNKTADNCTEGSRSMPLKVDVNNHQASFQPYVRIVPNQIITPLVQTIPVLTTTVYQNILQPTYIRKEPKFDYSDETIHICSHEHPYNYPEHTASTKNEGLSNEDISEIKKEILKLVPEGNGKQTQMRNKQKIVIVDDLRDDKCDDSNDSEIDKEKVRTIKTITQLESTKTIVRTVSKNEETAIGSPNLINNQGIITTKPGPQITYGYSTPLSSSFLQQPNIKVKLIDNQPRTITVTMKETPTTTVGTETFNEMPRTVSIMQNHQMDIPRNSNEKMILKELKRLQKDLKCSSNEGLNEIKKMLLEILRWNQVKGDGHRETYLEDASAVEENGIMEEEYKMALEKDNPNNDKVKPDKAKTKLATAISMGQPLPNLNRTNMSLAHSKSLRKARGTSKGQRLNKTNPADDQECSQLIDKGSKIMNTRQRKHISKDVIKENKDNMNVPKNDVLSKKQAGSNVSPFREILDEIASYSRTKVNLLNQNNSNLLGQDGQTNGNVSASTADKKIPNTSTDTSINTDNIENKFLMELLRFINSDKRTEEDILKILTFIRLIKNRNNSITATTNERYKDYQSSEALKYETVSQNLKDKDITYLSIKHEPYHSISSNIISSKNPAILTKTDMLDNFPYITTIVVDSISSSTFPADSISTFTVRNTVTVTTTITRMSDEEIGSKGKNTKTISKDITTSNPYTLNIPPRPHSIPSEKSVLEKIKSLLGIEDTKKYSEEEIKQLEENIEIKDREIRKLKDMAKKDLEMAEKKEIQKEKNVDILKDKFKSMSESENIHEAAECINVVVKPKEVNMRSKVSNNGENQSAGWDKKDYRSDSYEEKFQRSNFGKLGTLKEEPESSLQSKIKNQISLDKDDAIHINSDFSKIPVITIIKTIYSKGNASGVDDESRNTKTSNTTNSASLPSTIPRPKSVFYAKSDDRVAILNGSEAIKTITIKPNTVINCKKDELENSISSASSDNGDIKDTTDVDFPKKPEKAIKKPTKEIKSAEIKLSDISGDKPRDIKISIPLGQLKEVIDEIKEGEK